MDRRIAGGIRRRREALRLTQAELAREVWISPSYVAKIELATVGEPRTDVKQRLARALQVRVWTDFAGVPESGARLDPNLLYERSWFGRAQEMRKWASQEGLRCAVPAALQVWHEWQDATISETLPRASKYFPEHWDRPLEWKEISDENLQVFAGSLGFYSVLELVTFAFNLGIHRAEPSVADKREMFFEQFVPRPQVSRTPFTRRQDPDRNAVLEKIDELMWWVFAFESGVAGDPRMGSAHTAAGREADLAPVPLWLLRLVGEEGFAVHVRNDELAPWHIHAGDTVFINPALEQKGAHAPSLAIDTFGQRVLFPPLIELISKAAENKFRDLVTVPTRFIGPVVGRVPHAVAEDVVSYLPHRPAPVENRDGETD